MKQLSSYLPVIVLCTIVAVVSCSNSSPISATSLSEEHPLLLRSPSDGATVYIGDTVVITWDAIPQMMGSVKVQLTVGCDTLREYLVADRSFDPLDSCQWIVGEEFAVAEGLLPSDSVRIVVRDYDDCFCGKNTKFICVKKRY